MQTNNTKVIHVDVLDEDLGERYTGAFTIRRHTIKDNSAISVRRVQLNSGLHVEDNGRGIDQETDGLNHMLATLEVSLITAPTWFNLDDLYSVELMRVLYREVMNYQGTFRVGRKQGNVIQTQSPASQEGSSQKAQVPAGPGNAGVVVPEEISFSLEP